MPTHALAQDFEAAEMERIRALETYSVLDTSGEAIFDDVAQMAASMCDTPIALVSFVDGYRQWFKARVGIDATETPRDVAFCSHAIKVREPFVVNDATKDPRFAANPFVTGDDHFRFYAGAPLISPEGHALGTLCVIDRVPRELSASRIDGLKRLGQRLMAHLELRRKHGDLVDENQRRIDALEDSNAQLDALVRSQRAQIERAAQYNPQTGLPNRALFLSRLGQYLDSALLSGQHVTVFVFDIQRFGLVSESMGQSLLDSLLQQVGQRLAHVVGSAGAIAHVEADRFAALSTRLNSSEAAARHFREEILPTLATPYKIDDEEFRIAFKCGSASSPSDGIAPERLLRQAKTALMKARESQETHVTFTADLETRVSEIVTFETKLRRAIEREEFELHYQPKVSLLDGSIEGAEALLRWRDREPGQNGREVSDQWIPPALFIPALEATGLILPVGRWALVQAAKDLEEWQQRGFAAPRIAVNISPLQLRQREFLTEIGTILTSASFPLPLDLELTEAVLMDNTDGCIETLQAVRKMGVQIAIDDFGTGYSSLRYLARLPIDVLKIDMAFIHAMTKTPENMAIVSSIISLAHALRFRTVAEGVESEEQRKLLQLLRCDQMQGYLFSKAICKPEFESMLRPRAAR
jgi:diguanylate cyclase (GGDEF)-like protein